MVTVKVEGGKTTGADHVTKDKKKGKQGNKNKDSRTKRREQRRQDRAVRNGDYAAMQEERKSEYDGAVMLCPDCSTKCYKVKGYGRRYQCPRCSALLSMPELEFSNTAFVALYQGGVLYCWRALDTGNFPAIWYGTHEHNHESRIPHAIYNADIDTQHSAHFKTHEKQIVDMLAEHIRISDLKHLLDTKPVFVFHLNWAVEWSV